MLVEAVYGFGLSKATLRQCWENKIAKEMVKHRVTPRKISSKLCHDEKSKWKKNEGKARLYCVSKSGYSGSAERLRDSALYKKAL